MVQLNKIPKDMWIALEHGKRTKTMSFKFIEKDDDFQITLFIRHKNKLIAPIKLIGTNNNSELNIDININDELAAGYTLKEVKNDKIN